MLTPAVFTEEQARAAPELVHALTTAEDAEQVRRRAEQAVPTMSARGSARRAHALSIPVVALAAVGDRDAALALAGRVEWIATTIAQPHHRATCLAWLGHAHAAAGDTDGARRLFGQAERVATEAAGTKPQVWGLTELLKARAAAGDHESVRRVARRAERAALTEKSSDLWHGQPLSSLSMALTATGDVDEGERVAAMVPDNYHASQAWRALEQSLAASGKTGRARRAARWAAELEGRPNTP